MSKDEERLQLRMAVESSISDYKKICDEIGYPFVGDLIDVVYDATDGIRLKQE